MRSVLVTRPQPAADELAEKLRREGFEVYLAPMTEYVDIAAAVPDLGGYQGIIFTSAQAVNLFAQAHQERAPIVFAVGDATAQAASKAGFSRVYSASGGGDDVANLIRSKKHDLHISKVLHLCGEDTAQDLQSSLGGDGITVDRVPIYKAQFMDALPEDVGRALAEGDVSTVTLFSARTAANFARIMRQQDLKGVSADLEAVCLSDRVAAEIRALPWRAIRIAKNPHLESVLDILRAKEEGRDGHAPLPADPVIEAFGGLRPLANRLDITASTVQGWKKRGVIPETRVESVIEAARAANIDLDSLWSQGGIAMSDDDKSSGGGAADAGGAPKPQHPGSYQDRRHRTDRRQKRAVVDKRGIVHADTYTGPERRSGVDRRSYEQRQHDRIAKEKWRFFNRTVVTAALLAIAILYAGAFLLAPEFFEVKNEAKKIKEMQAQMDAINRRMAQMHEERETSLGSQLSNQIGQFQDTVQTIKSTAGAVTTVAKTVVQNTETGKALQQLINVLSTLNKMNATTAGRKAVDASMEKLKAIMAVTGADPVALNAAIAEARKSDPTLDKVFGNVEAKDLGAAALLLVLNEYREGVNSGQPFQNDLAVLRKFAGDDPELQKALDRLTPYAESGVLSRSRLQKEFEGLASDIVMAKFKGQDTSVKSQALSRLENLVKVRKVDDIKGDGVDATVARAQLKLNQGDVKGAIQELQTLDGAPAQTAQPFVNQAAGTLMADDAASAITQIIMQQIQERTGFDLQSLFQNVAGQWPGSGGGAVPLVSPGAQGGGGVELGPSGE